MCKVVLRQVFWGSDGQGIPSKKYLMKDKNVCQAFMDFEKSCVIEKSELELYATR